MVPTELCHKSHATFVFVKVSQAARPSFPLQEKHRRDKKNYATKLLHSRVDPTHKVSTYMHGAQMEIAKSDQRYQMETLELRDFPRMNHHLFTMLSSSLKFFSARMSRIFFWILLDFCS